MEDKRTAKKKKTSSVSTQNFEFAFFDELPDDLLATVIFKVVAAASCPADFFNLLLVCKRLNALGFSPMILSELPPKAFTCKTHKWCIQAHNFLKSCADAGNLEAIYTLATIHFYCLGMREIGISLWHKSADKNHGPSLYSLALITLNKSDGTTKDPLYQKNGLSFAVKAVAAGHVDALSEMGHYLKDGSCIHKNEAFGTQLILLANAQELAFKGKITSPPPSSSTEELLAWLSDHPYPRSDSELNLYEVHPANRFLIEWHNMRGREMGVRVRMCSREGCGRSETRWREFRRCTGCDDVSYCSRACQDYDWKSMHSDQCMDDDDMLVALFD